MAVCFFQMYNVCAVYALAAYPMHALTLRAD